MISKLAFVSILLAIFANIANCGAMPRHQTQPDILEVSMPQRESWIESVPSTLVKEKLYKLRAMNSDISKMFESQLPPACVIPALCVFYFILSYLPSIIWVALMGCLRGPKEEKYPRSGFVLNQQDFNDIQSVLKIVKDLQGKSTNPAQSGGDLAQTIERLFNEQKVSFRKTQLT